MSRMYNAGSKSDMKKFMDELISDVEADVNAQLNESTYPFECECGCKFDVVVGDNVCPSCKTIISVSAPEWHLQ